MSPLLSLPIIPPSLPLFMRWKWEWGKGGGGEALVTKGGECKRGKRDPFLLPSPLFSVSKTHRSRTDSVQEEEEERRPSRRGCRHEIRKSAGTKLA